MRILISTVISIVAIVMTAATTGSAANLDLPTSLKVPAIHNWQNDIPLTEQNIVNLLETEAAYFSFETDEVICGGEIFDISLLEHQVAEQQKQQPIHVIALKFKLTKAENYCTAVVATTCDAQIHIYPANKIEMSDWTCY